MIRSSIDGEECVGIVAENCFRGFNSSFFVRGSSLLTGFYVVRIMEGGVCKGYVVEQGGYAGLKFVRMDYRVVGWKRVGPKMKWQPIAWE